MMKKVLFVMLFVGCAALSARAAESKEVTDISPDNWAYDSVKKVVDKGYMALYDNGEFRGEQPLSRTVFAVAFAKLIEQLESGQFKSGGGDMKEIKKINEELKSTLADYEARLGKLDQRLQDIESGKVVLQVDLSKATVEFRDKIEKMQKDIASLEDQLGVVNNELAAETKKRKSAVNTVWIGVIAAIAVGAASN